MFSRRAFAYLVCILFAAAPLSSRAADDVADWLTKIPVLRTGDKAAFSCQSRWTLDEISLDVLISWAPPDRRCVIVRDAHDGVPLMIAVDGKVWVYDTIGKQIVIVRAEPWCEVTMLQGYPTFIMGMRADFPTEDSKITLQLDFARLIAVHRKIHPDQWELDAANGSATFREKEGGYSLITNPAKPEALKSFEMFMKKKTILRMDHFAYGAEIPAWHKAIDNRELAKTMTVTAVAEQEGLTADARAKLNYLKELLRNNKLFYLRGELRDETRRKAMEVPLPATVAEMVDNDGKLSKVWLEALAAQKFELPKFTPAETQKSADPQK